MYYKSKGASSRAFKDKYVYDPVIKERSNGLSKRDKMWLEMACRIAVTSLERTRHGCLIVSGSSVYAVGVNTARNKPGIIENVDALSVHAEINALRKARKSNLRGSTAYIARVNNHGEKRQSRPCPDCLKALRDAGVKRICYTINGEEYL